MKPVYPPSEGLNKSQYVKYKQTMGVVLVAATGQRTWNCGEFENAELRSIGFDLVPSQKPDNAAPDLVINTSEQGFMNYAYLLEPGTYAVSFINIKVARSMKDVGYVTASRSNLIHKAEEAKGGTFSVRAGEVVYIGHFGLDCAYGPTLWRYYSEDRESFEGLVRDYGSYFPYLSLENVSYRLFDTKEFGREYTLQ